MAKTTGLFRIIVGAVAVVLSRKESRDKLKEQYNKYKRRSRGLQRNARGLASQLSSRMLMKQKMIQNHF